MYYRVVKSGAYLMHYGVKGMKWGVRKEYVPKSRRKAVKTSPQKSKGAMDILLADPELTTYATVAVAVLAYWGGKRVSDLKKQGWFSEKYTAADVGKCKTTKEEDIKIVNPLPGVSDSTIDKLAYTSSISEFSKGEQDQLNKAMKDGWFENCVYCTTAGMLRRKGYDVEAKNSPGRGHSAEQTMKWWKGSKLEDFYGRGDSDPKHADAIYSQIRDSAAKDKSSDSDFVSHMTKTLQSQGEGAYGDLRLHGFFSGHSVEYSVDRDGVKIHDNQIRHTINGLDEKLKYHDQFIPHYSAFIRLDNCEPDLDRILKEHAVKPRGK